MFRHASQGVTVRNFWLWSCVSINVGPMNQMTKTCDLNNATVDGSPGSTLKQKIGYLHLAVDVRVN